MLVARRADRLEQLAATLRQQHGIRVAVAVTDLTDAGAVAQLVLEVEGQGFQVTHLINNAGFGLRGPFADLDGPSQARMIDLNCRVPVELAHTLLPAMLASGRSGILNAASTAAFQPGPWMAVYYATKAFLLSFSEALHEEVRSRGVSVAALCPGPTRTDFFEVAAMADSPLSRLPAGEPGKVVADGLKALRNNRAVKVSGPLNAALAGSMRFTPRVARKVAGILQKARGAQA